MFVTFGPRMGLTWEMQMWVQDTAGTIKRRRRQRREMRDSATGAALEKATGRLIAD